MSTLHYIEAGTGEALILLHSGGMTGEEWKPQIPIFSKSFRVIVPDQLGHGNSPMVSEKLAIGDIGRAVVELMDELGVDKAHMVGSSMGGAVALWLTLNHPSRIARLVLFRVGYRKSEDTHKGTRDMGDPAYWRSFGMHNWLARIHRPQGGPDAWKQVIKRVSEALDPATSDHAHSAQTLAGISHETLIVVGDRDPVAPLDHVLEMYSAIPNSGLWVLPFTTHVAATNTWRADCFALEIGRFLQRKK